MKNLVQEVESIEQDLKFSDFSTKEKIMIISGIALFFIVPFTVGVYADIFSLWYL